MVSLLRFPPIVGCVRQLARRVISQAMVLLYHRVADKPVDPQWLCISPRRFAEHLETLRRHYQPMSLHQLAKRQRWGWFPSRTVVVTFDDGYADNLRHAKPLLEQFEVPATVFVVAGHADENREFWWDELERILLSNHELPDVLNATIAGERHAWHFGAGNRDEVSHGEAWHVLLPTNPSPKHKAYREIATLLRNIDAQEREDVLSVLRDWAGVNRSNRPGQRTLDAAGIQALARGGLVQVGAHTITHPVLSTLSIEAQQTEIVNGKNKLEEILEEPVTSFSYPFGGRSDYTEDTVQIVRHAGFDCACSNFPGRVRFGTDRYQLPRYIVRDWDGEEFSRRLAEWFHE